MLNRSHRSILCAALILALILTGIGVGRSGEIPVLGQAQSSGIVLLRAIERIPVGNAYLREDQQNTIQPVRRGQNTTRLRDLRRAASGMVYSEARGADHHNGAGCGAIRRGLTASPSQCAIISLIHRTRRKRC